MYKDKTFYEFIRTLKYDNGTFYENRVVYNNLKNMLEDAYNEGIKKGESKSKEAYLQGILTTLIFSLLVFLVLLVAFLLYLVQK